MEIDPWTLKRLVLFPLYILLLNVLYVVKCVVFSLPRFFITRRAPSVVRTPEARFQGLDALGYTFKPNYVTLPIGGGKTLPRLHYLDEGPRDSQETILCLHGEPSWSFLYRRMIPGLVAAGYRVIVPDFIGFGKSDKYTLTDSYSHDLHTLTLRLLLDHLKVTNITLVCQDWGGLTGLTVVKDCPHLFSRLVLMNTGLPAGVDPLMNTLNLGTPFLLWQSVVRVVGVFLPIGRTFKISIPGITPAILQAYKAPFPSYLYKAGAAKWPLMVPIHSRNLVASEMMATRSFLSTTWAKPVLIMFSDKDPITRGQDQILKGLMPHAVVKTVHDAGHYLQEDKGEELSENIIRFINKELS